MHSPNEPGDVSRRGIEDILLLERKIDGKQLEEALEIQKEDKRDLGKVLVSLGHITHEDLAQVLSTQLGIEYVDLSGVQVDPEVLGIIGEDVLVRHRAMPLRVENGRLLVAMSDPNDVHARSDLTISAGRRGAGPLGDQDPPVRDVLFADRGPYPAREGPGIFE
jgi:type IV pilus assembly protein PilB